jgi:translation initiation factor IF-1
MAGDHLELVGVVRDEYAGGNFLILVEGQTEPVRATLSGRLRQNRIRVIIGDRVKVRFSPYDLSRGQITYRMKPND